MFNIFVCFLFIIFLIRDRVHFYGTVVSACYSTGARLASSGAYAVCWMFLMCDWASTQLCEFQWHQLFLVINLLIFWFVCFPLDLSVFSNLSQDQTLASEWGGRFQNWIKITWRFFFLLELEVYIHMFKAETDLLKFQRWSLVVGILKCCFVVWYWCPVAVPRTARQVYLSCAKRKLTFCSCSSPNSNYKVMQRSCPFRFKPHIHTLYRSIILIPLSCDKVLA